MLPSCSCQAAGPVAQADGGWLCSCCYSKSDITDYGCGDELSANFNADRGLGHGRLSHAKRTALRPVRMAPGLRRKRLSVQVHGVSKATHRL